ncbi:MAG: ABC transporter ATP-binding protein [Chloroflexi bacterium]|nr:ABC transporter ATP-binding protein [Chloroflexota bacterium]
MTALIEVRDLLVRREKQTVLEIAHLSVEAGEVLAVVGPNGAGKSTLFLTLARLLKHERGVIRFFNGHESISTLEYRRRIALVLQEPLLLDASVRENAAIGLRFRGTPKAEADRRVAHWLERLGVAHLAERSARKLSGGESQRVSLARAFVLEPELLLLDEPFTALDSPTRARLLEDLKAVLGETGTTTIFITHDLREAEKLGTRMAVMLKGRVHQVGKPREVFAHPADSQVAEFLGMQM